MIEIQNKQYLTVEEVAAKLGITSRRVRYLVKSKILNAFRPSSRKTFILPEYISDYLEGNK